MRMSHDEYASAAELYDHVTTYTERRDVRFYVDEAVAAQGMVLEIGCGTGRVLLPTARAGVEIVGLDASPAMLAICGDRIAREPADVRARVTLIEGDMRAFDLEARFALVTIPFRPFQHLVSADDQ